MADAVMLCSCGHSFNQKTVDALQKRRLPCPVDQSPIQGTKVNIDLSVLVQELTQDAPIPSQEELEELAKTLFKAGMQFYEGKNYPEATKAFLGSTLLSSNNPLAEQYLTQSTASPFPPLASSALPTQAPATEPLNTKKPTPLVPPPSPVVIHNLNVDLSSHTSSNQQTYAPQIHYAPVSQQTTFAPRSYAFSSVPSKQEPALPSYVSQALNKTSRGRALIRATEEGNMQAIQYLLGQDTDVNAKDGSNRTPLSVACEKRNGQILQLLIENGANTNDEVAKDALSLAVDRRDLEIVKILVNEGAEVDYDLFSVMVNKEFVDLVQLVIDHQHKSNVIQLGSLQYPKGNPWHPRYCIRGSNSSHYDPFRNIDHALVDASYLGNVTLFQMLYNFYKRTGQESEMGGVRPQCSRGIIDTWLTLTTAALLTACNKGYIQLVRFLLEKENFDLEQTCHLKEENGNYGYTYTNVTLRKIASDETQSQEIKQLIASFQKK